VGEETAILLAQNFKTIDAIAKADEEDLNAIDGIGPIVAQAISGWFREKENKSLIERLKKVLQIQNPDLLSRFHLDSRPLKGKTFVLTGGLESMSRDEAKKKYESSAVKSLARSPKKQAMSSPAAKPVPSSNRRGNWE